MVKKVEKTHRKGTHEMGTGEHEMSGGSVTESHLLKFPPAVFRGGCTGLPSAYALGDSQRQGSCSAGEAAGCSPGPKVLGGFKQT